jgi:hypothetical protein
MFLLYKFSNLKNYGIFYIYLIPPPIIAELFEIETFVKDKSEFSRLIAPPYELA